MLVYLTGYRGSGKSTVGRLVAGRLGWGFVDLDDQITAAAKRSVREIFEAEGEAGFRNRESAAMAEVAGRDRTVIALGGGALLREQNRAMIPRGRSAVVYLRAGAEELHRRIHADAATAAHRPALTHLGGGLDEVRQLLAAREGIYREVMTHELEVTDRRPEDLADELHRLIVKLGDAAV